MLSEDTVPGLRRLTDAVHAEGAAVAAQIGHAGPVANARSNGAPRSRPRAASRPMGSRLRAVDVAGIERITEDYRRAATLAVEAGFDCIEVHVGHNYLLSAFLSPKLNQRDDQFGGSVENRARFARTVLRTVRDAAGPGRGGDGQAQHGRRRARRAVARRERRDRPRCFEADGALDALELTGGSSLANPMYLFRGDAPRQEFAATLPRPLRLGFRVVGHRFLRSTRTRRPSSCPTRGSSSTRSRPAADPARRHHRAGRRSRRRSPRASRSWPWPARCCASPTCRTACRRAASTTSLCIHCNKCMPTIYSGTRCVLVAGAPG